ncbi:MAG TPA: glutamyl-tRNA reductase [Gammaproteobacteria bacterium]|nr:glutamyl-tRNA reductase [Gammaproteobacteria bacterium]
MYLLTLGLSHKTAPVALREKTAFSADTLPDALRSLRESCGVEEAAILSTCNRTEIYCRGQEGYSEAVIDWVGHYHKLSTSDLHQCLYQHPDRAAVQHAFRVACGLDSMVLGEPQILGQMKRAFSCANQAGATGKILNRLFQHTFSVAKQIRTDTAIGASAVSVAYAAVNLSRRIFAHLSNQTVLLIGAGETIELVARHLLEQGVHHMIVSNRTVERAQRLAECINGEAISLQELPQRLHEADIIISSTAAPLPILGKGMIESALKVRKHRPVFMVDLAVPRDIEEQVRELDNIYLYTIDDLQDVIETGIQSRQQAAVEAEKIIDLQVVQFMRWMHSLDAVPTIRQLRQQLEMTSQTELNKALKKLAQGADPVQVVNHLSHSLTNKFAHQPSNALRRADLEGDPTLLKATHKLFDLGDLPGDTE